MKFVKCPVHGYIELPDLCRKFADHPIFQRLGRIGQLGSSKYVYPSAGHTRKEHSLGVMHMAGLVVDQLRTFVDIDQRTKELIQLGGLYHDIGHVAYSHLMDEFICSAKIFSGEGGSLNYGVSSGDVECCRLSTSTNINPDEFFRKRKHEDRSVFLLHLVNEELGLLEHDEAKFVENVILGVVPSAIEIAENTKKSYLYEIVNNKQCNVDVDKMDYLYRDALHTGMPLFQSKYIIMNMVISNCKTTGNSQNEDGDYEHIAFKKKAAVDLEDMFRNRHSMFKKVYQHHTSRKIDKIYTCCFRRLSKMDSGYPDLFKYGVFTDDYNVETLLRSDDRTKELMTQIDYRDFSHNCELCDDFSLDVEVPISGSIDQVVFV